MWWCAVDMDPRGTEITLGTLDWRCRLPLRVESTGWRECTDPGRVIGRVETWESRYQVSVKLFVVTSRTPWACIDKLCGRGSRVETVLYEDLEDVLQAGGLLGLHPGGRRGVWLCSLAMSRQVAIPSRSTWTGWDWIYAGLCRQVRSLAGHLQSEGLANPAISGSAAGWEG